MSTSVSAIQVTNTNKCPHGLPLGACPICNGMGGGGSRVAHKEPPKTNKEWSYMKCLIAGQMMRGQEAQKATSQAIFQSQLNFAKEVRQNVQAFAVKVQNLALQVYNSLPPQLQVVFAQVTAKVLMPLVKMVSKLPVIIEKVEQFINNIKGQIQGVCEKLTAIFGEIKGFVEKKLQENLKKLTKKILAFFVFGTDEDNYKNDKELEIFKSRELRKIKNAILRLRKKGEEDGNSID